MSNRGYFGWQNDFFDYEEPETQEHEICFIFCLCCDEDIVYDEAEGPPEYCPVCGAKFDPPDAP